MAETPIVSEVAATPETTAMPPQDAAPRTVIDYDGDWKVFRSLVLKEMVLVAATFGIYWFWARTRVRRFMWANTTINGSPLEYAGRGIELFIGFVVAAIIVGVAYWIVQLATAWAVDPGISIFATPLILVPFFLLLTALATYRARRYMVLRTSWRGIRCGLGGSTMGFIVKMLPWGLLTILTLGLAYPWLAVAAQRYLISSMSLGSAQFRYDGRGGALFWTWVLVLLLLIPTFGLSLTWWTGRVAKFHYNATHLDDLKLQSDISPGQVVSTWILGSILAGMIIYPTTGAVTFAGGYLASMVPALAANPIILGAAAAVGFSIFFALSWAMYLYFVDYKIAEHHLKTMTVLGTLDWSKIEQAHPEVRGPGDGLDAVLSMDGI